MRLTKNQKELILADFHTGAFSHRELADKYNTSHVTIGKIVKGLTPKHKDKVTTQIAIQSALSKESYQEVTAVESIVKEKTRHLNFFKDSALRNQELANSQLNKKMKIHEIESHSRLTSKNKDTVLGKDIETSINISNQVTNNSLKVVFE